MSYRKFVHGLGEAYRHRGGIKTFAIGALDPEWFRALQQEVLSILAEEEASDVGDAAHVTHWTRPTGRIRQYSLFNSTGKTSDYTDDYGSLRDCGHKRLVFPERQAIARFAHLFGPSLRNLRINGVEAAARLSPHEENSIAVTRLGTRHVIRFHLPVFTTDSAWIYLDEERYRYREGVLYFFHHGCVHASSNEGPGTRVHFVLDCFLTRALYETLLAPDARNEDSGLRFFRDAAREVPAEAWDYDEFVAEDGRVVPRGEARSRRLPGTLAWYRQNYPSLFGAPK